MARLVAFAGDACLVGHNLAFDLAFLVRAGFPQARAMLDTAELASCFAPTAPSYALQRLVAALARPAEARAHRALDDAEAAALLCCELRRAAAALRPDTLEGAQQLAPLLGEPFVEFVHEAYRERAKTAFVEQGSRHETGGLSTAGGPSVSRTAGQPAAAALPLESVFAADGPLAAAFEAYEERPEQLEMAQAVERTFTAGGALVVEAGTGTGKSLAYLVPALRAARAGRRVVISTYTTALQDQLVRNDLPRLLGALGLDLEVALLKGRANYLCPRRWHLLRTVASSREEARLALKTLVWRERTEAGDRVELNLLGGEQAAWSRICAEDESCTARRCAMTPGGCYLERARAAAANAAIVVVNHALLAADARSRHRLLPDFPLLVVDEAHHLEEVAAGIFGTRVDAAELRRALERVSRASLVDSALARGDADASAVRAEAERAEEAIGETFRALAGLMPAAPHERGYEDRRRITDGVRRSAEWLAVELAAERLRDALAGEGAAAERMVAADALVAGEGGREDAVELEAATAELRAAETALGRVAHAYRPSDVCWLTLEAGSLDVPVLQTAPAHSGGLLARYVLEPRDGVVLTSATLAVGESFAFAMDRFGLDDRADALRLGTSFDYRRQALLVLPQGLADPYEPAFVDQVAEILADLARALGGRTLALFTAHTMLRAVSEKLRTHLAASPIAVLAQGGGASRRALLEQFAAGDAVLLGTASFWEGIDVAGDALRCVVVVKLPFLVPDDPVVAGRSERYDDPFREYHVPVAAQRLKQGFGRLIRSRQDRGAVVLLDRRITLRAYGEVLLSALPPCALSRPEPGAVAQAVAAWCA